MQTAGFSSPENAISASTSGEMAKIYRKVMWRIIPFLFVAFLMAWIDRVNVGFVRQQMNETLGFSNTVYGFGAGVFFIGYFLFEVPSNLALQRFGVRLTISRIAIGWGLASVAMTWVTTPLQFYILRFLVGSFEAGLWPGIVLYITYWLPSARRSKAYALVNSASAVSGIIGAPLAGILLVSMNGIGGWHGWQWVFFLEGIPSILLGFAAIWLLCDKPEQAKWLTSREQQLLLAELARDNADGTSREHSYLQALKSRQVWLYSLIYFTMIMGSATIIFWAPAMLSDVGFSNPKTIGYIISGVYIIGAAAMILNGYVTERTNNPRLHAGIPVLICAAGCAALGLLLFDTSPWIILALCIAHPAVLASIPVFWQLPNRVLIGTAAAVGIALINSTGNLAGFVAPFVMGMVRDATGQISSVVLVVSGILAFGGIMILRQKVEPLDAKAKSARE